MSIYNLLNKFLWFFGYRKQARLLVSGLDNSGKTTFVCLNDIHQVVIHSRRRVFDVHEIEVGRFRGLAIELPNFTRRRNFSLSGFDGVIYLIDASDQARFEEAFKDLEQLLQNEELTGVPVLVIGNKIDKPNAASEDELKQALHLYLTLPEGTQIEQVGLYMGSVIQRRTYLEGFAWLEEALRRWRR